ncbi:MAG: TonB-dependent receptor [Chryseolinea sp.]
MRIAVLLVVCSISIGLSYGQDCPMVNGYVVDEATGEALPGASVKAGSGNAGQLADADGSFSLPAMHGDTLRVSFVGYEARAMVIESCEVSVALRPIAIGIEAVVIEGDRLITEEFAIRKLSRLDVYTNPSAKADPILAVNSMPFATTTDESANISLRGGSPAETGIFLNDVPIEDAVRYSQMNGIGAFSIFNTALMDEVQVYPGNPPLEFGNSTSGVIALYSDEQIPDRNTTQLSATLASLGAYHARKLTTRSSLTLFSNVQSSALFNKVNARALRGLKSFFSADAGVHYFSRLSPTLSLKIFNYTLREAYRYQYIHPTLEGIFKQDRVRNFTVSNLRKQFGGPTLSLNQGLSFSSAKYAFSTLNVEAPMQNYYAAINVHRATPNYQWKTGLVYEYKQSGTRGQYPTYTYAYGAKFGSIPVKRSDNIELLEWFGYYKQYIGNALIVGAGIRKNLPHDEVDYLSWQGNVNIRPVRRLSVNVSAGDYNKYVLQRERDAKGYLLKSRQHSIDVSYLNRKLDLSLSVFRKRIERSDRLEQLSGVELFGRIKLGDSWRTQLSLTSLNAHDDRDIGTPYNISYFVRGNVEYKLNGMWTFTMVFLAREGSYYSPVQAAVFHEDLGLFEPVYAQMPARLPSYNTIDFSASRIFLLNAKTTAIAFLNVSNIADFRNVQSYIYNSDYTTHAEQLFSRRVVYFGIVLSF